MSRYRPVLIAVPALIVIAVVVAFLYIPSLSGKSSSPGETLPVETRSAVTTPRPTSTPDSRPPTITRLPPTITPFLLRGTFTPTRIPNR